MCVCVWSERERERGWTGLGWAGRGRAGWVCTCLGWVRLSGEVWGEAAIGVRFIAKMALGALSCVASCCRERSVSASWAARSASCGTTGEEDMEWRGERRQTWVGNPSKFVLADVALGRSSATPRRHLRLELLPPFSQAVQLLPERSPLLGCNKQMSGLGLRHS